MSETNVNVPVRGVTLALDAEALSGLVGGGISIPAGSTLQLVNGATSKTAALPEGGTWMWVCLRVDANFNNTGANVVRYVTGAGMSAGGTVVSPAALASVAYQVICLKVA